MKLHHIGIAVKNISEKLKIWHDVLGLEVKCIEEVREQKVKVALLPLGGMNIELLEPLGEESPVYRFIEKRGEGIHHLCFEVDDIDNMLAEMRNKGLKLIDEVPRMGAGGRKIAFVHPKDVGGVLIELSEK